MYRHPQRQFANLAPPASNETPPNPPPPPTYEVAVGDISLTSNVAYGGSAAKSSTQIAENYEAVMNDVTVTSNPALAPLL